MDAGCVASSSRAYYPVTVAVGPKPLPHSAVELDRRTARNGKMKDGKFGRRGKCEKPLWCDGSSCRQPSREGRCKGAGYAAWLASSTNNEWRREWLVRIGAPGENGGREGNVLSLFAVLAKTQNRGTKEMRYASTWDCH